MIKTLLLLMLFFTSLASQAQQLTVEVTDISNALKISVLSSDGIRTFYALKGIKPIYHNRQVHRNSHQRLKGLIMGRTVQIEVHKDGTATVFWGGLNINLRLIREGLLLVDTQGINQLTQIQQQDFVNAQEYAIKNNRGIWLNHSKSQSRRLHY